MVYFLTPKNLQIKVIYLNIFLISGKKFYAGITIFLQDWLFCFRPQRRSLQKFLKQKHLLEEEDLRFNGMLYSKTTLECSGSLRMDESDPSVLLLSSLHPLRIYKSMEDETTRL